MNIAEARDAILREIVAERRRMAEVEDDLAEGVIVGLDKAQRIVESVLS